MAEVVLLTDDYCISSSIHPFIRSRSAGCFAPVESRESIRDFFSLLCFALLCFALLCFALLAADDDATVDKEGR